MRDAVILVVIIAMASFILGNYAVLGLYFSPASLNDRHVYALIEPDIVVNYGLLVTKLAFIKGTAEAYRQIEQDTGTEVHASVDQTAEAFWSDYDRVENTYEQAFRDIATYDTFVKYLTTRVLGFTPCDAKLGESGTVQYYSPVELYDPTLVLHRTCQPWDYWYHFYLLPNPIRIAGSYLPVAHPQVLLAAVTLTPADEAETTLRPWYEPYAYRIYLASPVTNLLYILTYRVYYGYRPPGVRLSDYMFAYVYPACMTIVPMDTADIFTNLTSPDITSP